MTADDLMEVIEDDFAIEDSAGDEVAEDDFATEDSVGDEVTEDNFVTEDDTWEVTEDKFGGATEDDIEGLIEALVLMTEDDVESVDNPEVVPFTGSAHTPVLSYGFSALWSVQERRKVKRIHSVKCKV